MNESHPTDKNSNVSPQETKGSTQESILSPRRLWIFRLFAIVLIPLIIFGAVEMALFFTGQGYPTDYLLKVRIEDKDYFIPNEKFGYRFFPSTISRTPLPDRFPAQKAEGVYRIFVFGESAALGDPDNSYNIARYMDTLLEGRYPNAEFEVICAAMTAINSHSILPMARECARMDGDLWVIYMGNNEMVGPFGASTIFGARSPGLGFVRTSLALKKSRLGQVIASFASNLSSTSKVPEEWSGINMFEKNLLRHDDPARLRAYKNFEGNLKDIVKAGRQAGVPIILSTVGSNLKDCSPFASLHRENLDTSKKQEWDMLFEDGLALEKAEEYEQALSRYKDASAIDSEYAELHFRIGTCQLALGRSEQARESFIHARDYDALAVRADTRINRIVMDSIFENDDRILRVDAVEALSLQSPAGIPGEELFYEHVHFTTDGNFALAQIIAEQTETFLPPEIVASQTEDWPDRETCNQLLALTLWDQMRLWQNESQQINDAPFSSRSSNPRNKHYMGLQIKRIKEKATTEGKKLERHLYEAALERNPNDPILINNYSQLLEAAGKIDEAIEQTERYRALLPYTAPIYYQLAELLAKAGRHQEAITNLEKALELRNDYAPARQALNTIKLRITLNGSGF